MKVLHIISSGGMYGAEAVILNLSRTIGAGVHSSVLGVFANSANPNLQLHEAAAKQDIESHLILCNGQIDRGTIAAIRDLAKRTNADVVHAHGYKADIYVYLALRSSTVPLVSTCHTWYDTDRMLLLYGIVDRFVLRSYARVVAVSDEVRQRLLKAGVREHKIRLVRNGIDLRPFNAAEPSLRFASAPDADGAPIVGLVGRLAWEKGVDVFLQAAARVLVESPAVKFVVVGEGPDREKLERLLDELNIRGNVSMLGRREDMPEVYASLDVMVSSSRQEGLPMAILEGMASGLPLVATAVGEVPTVVQNDRTGVLVAPDDVEVLAAAIAALLRDPARRKRLGAAARQLIEDEYSAERMTADYLRVYDEAIERFHHAPARTHQMSTSGRPPRIFMMDLWATVPYYTAYLSKALLKEDVDLTVGSISYYLDPACFSSRGIKVDPGLMDVVGRFRLPRLPRRVLKLAESMLNMSALTARFTVSPPDVVHVQFLPMLKERLPLDLWFVEFCRRRGAKIVLTVHDLLPHDTGDAHWQAFEDLYEMVDGIICHSGHIKARLAEEFQVPVAKISMIPHGPFFYDLPATGEAEALRSFQLEPGKPLVLWQGIVFPYKGIDVLLRAWKQVEAKGGLATLLIAGTGAPELLAQIRAQVTELDLKRVKLHFRFISAEELVALYRAADVVVYPYRAITTSGALATGLALGKAIVATDLPVFRELLTDRENALLVPPQDPAALAGALIELTENAALRQQIADQVRAMDFGDRSWLVIAEQTITAYRRVVGC